MDIKEILNKAFNLGQTYWQQADIEYSSKADLTLDKFNELSLAVEMDIAMAKFQMDEIKKQRNNLLEALELARSEINILLVDAGVVFPHQQETICRIDAAIAAARGEV